MTAAPHLRPIWTLRRHLCRQTFTAKDISWRLSTHWKKNPVETSEPTHANTIADQIAEYRRDKVTGTNSIKYRIQNNAHFPDLSSYALCILSIPASEVACKRACSTAGAYFSHLRVRMGNRDLMFVHANDQQLWLWREERRSMMKRKK